MVVFGFWFLIGLLVVVVDLQLFLCCLRFVVWFVYFVAFDLFGLGNWFVLIY